MATNKKKKRRKASAFYDLNVSTEGMSQAERASLITMALELGYSGVAINHVVKGPITDSHLCKSSHFDLSSIVSAHKEVAYSAQFHRDVLGVPRSGSYFRLYDRLTIVLDTAIQASALNSIKLVLRSYDLVAILPTNQKVFDQACTNLEIDVISLDFLHRLPLRLKAPSIQAALERDIFFEVSLSGAFQDIKARRELFANAQVLQELTRGRNIIITSGAHSPMDLRGPNDIANLGTMFGLSREAGKLSVSNNCKQAILRGLERKLAYKSAVIVEKIPAWECQSGADEPWFDVPKVWDPLSNAKAGVEYLLTEKTENNVAVGLYAETVEHTEAETGQLGDSVEFNTSQAQTENLEGFPNTASHDGKERGFLSIDFGGTPRSLFVDGLKVNGGDTSKEKHLGKHRKRKKNSILKILKTSKISSSF